MQKCGSPNASKTTRAVLPIPTRVCCSCVGPNDGFSSFMIRLCGISNVLTQMLGHVTADRGCTNTVRESAPKGFWEKNPLPHQRTELNLRQYYPLADQSDALPLYQLGRPTPWRVSSLLQFRMPLPISFCLNNLLFLLHLFQTNKVLFFYFVY